MFWFGDTITDAAFTLGNVKYTLDVSGFRRNETGVPIQRFITKEYSINTVYIWARIVTLCTVVVSSFQVASLRVRLSNFS